ncbi:hypothetical protein VTI28DRAFT_6230 [Corynascus sepedonium]
MATRTKNMGCSALEMSDKLRTTKLLLNDEESHEVENQDKADLNLLYPFHVAARPPTVEISFDKHKLRQQVVLDLLISRGADAYASYPDGRFVFQAIV